ncbi:MAG: glucose-6-phosphate dehydrogenase, partial [Chitinivibrionales bacterium]
RQEKGIDSTSTTETYAQLELGINNFRWTGTPIYIRTGKAMNRRGTEIGLRFKRLPRLLFNEQGQLASNKIIFKIQPAEGIILDLSSKTPGNAIQITNTNMAFCYRDSFGQVIPEAYQKLLMDALCGDRTLFVSAEENELSWKTLAHVLEDDRVGFYEKGSVPDPCWGVEWIDFERYSSICA